MSGGARAIAALRGRFAGYNAWDLATAILLAGLIVIAVATFDSYAISNDEEVQRHYGELIIAYYRSGFTDQSLFHFDNLYLYGGLFDIAAKLFELAFPGIEPFSIRHILCVLIGIAGIAAAAATARLIAGPRAGFIAAALLAVCGPWYGSMFNHTKDIPFAAAMAGAVYFMFRVMRSLPQPRRGDVLSFGLLLGAALGIRVLGLLLVVYTGIAVLIRTMQARGGPWRDHLDFFSRSAIALTPAFLIGYAVMIAGWPWSALSPLNPIRGLLDFAGFHYQIHTILNGQIYEMAAVPRWYVSAYLLIKLPLVMLVGAAMALIGAAVQTRGFSHTRIDPAKTGLLAFVALFPVICEVVNRGPAFSGLRHFLFVVPALAALSGIGLDWLLSLLKDVRRQLAPAGYAALAAIVLWNASVLVRLHPYQYLFYNPLVGGLEGAAGRYVTDYWVNMMPEAVDNLENYIVQLDQAGGHPQPYTVAVCGERLPFVKQAGNRLQWTEDWSKAEFFIAPTHMNCDRALPGRVISDIGRLGARIGVVKDRRGLIENNVTQQR